MSRTIVFRLVLPVAAALCVSAASVTQAQDDPLIDASRDFISYCAPCHGVEGRGDGPVADHLKVRPADLTAIRRDNEGQFPAEAVYLKIEGVDMPGAHGTSKMPVWGLWFTNQAIGESILMEDTKPAAEKVEARIQALVAYIKSIQE